MYGNQVIDKRNVLNISKVIKEGKIQNWEDIEFLWRMIFNQEMKVDSKEHPVLYATYANEEKVSKERTCLVFFETFNVPGFFNAIHPLLSLYALGRTNGFVVDSGEDTTTVCTIKDGNILPQSNMVTNLGGSDISNFFQRLVKEKQITLDFLQSRDIKEKVCYVAMEYSLENENYKRGITQPTSFILPDGTPLDIYEECIKPAESMFNPTMIQKFSPSITHMIQSLIHNLDTRKEKNYNLHQLVNNIIISGGNSLLPNFSSRIQKEVMSQVPQHLNSSLRVITPKKREHLAWKGGSVVSELSSFLKMWISRVDYEEYGPGIVHRKCNYL